MLKKQWILSVMAVVCLSASACTEEAVKDLLDGIACTEADQQCSNNKAYICVDGILTSTACGTDQVCSIVDGVPGCQAKPADDVPGDGDVPAQEGCEATDNTCKDDSIALICDGNKLVETPCLGKVCKNGLCVEACKPSCDEATNSKVTCDAQGNAVTQACGTDEVCTVVENEPVCQPKAGGEEPGDDKCSEADNYCKDASILMECVNGVMQENPCSKSEECRLYNQKYTCMPIVHVEPENGGQIGDACTCEGDNCIITITGAELKAMIPADYSVLLTSAIKDTDNITGPNIFAGASIKGCEGVQVPEGMMLGCVTQSQVAFPQSLSDLVSSIATLLPIIGVELPEVLVNALNILAENILKPGISFYAPNGYCTVGAMSANMGEGEDSGLTDMFDINSLINKLAAGDYTAAKASACPSGSVMLDYGMTDQFSGGYVMCSKTCQSNDDCRADEGYVCTEMATRMPSADETIDNVPKAKVCIDERNIAALESMLDAFMPLLEDTEAGTI